MYNNINLETFLDNLNLYIKYNVINTNENKIKTEDIFDDLDKLTDDFNNNDNTDLNNDISDININDNINNSIDDDNENNDIANTTNNIDYYGSEEISNTDNNEDLITDIENTVKTISLINKFEDIYYNLFVIQNKLEKIIPDKTELWQEIKKFENLLLLLVQKIDKTNYEEIEKLLDAYQKTLYEYIKDILSKNK